MDGSICASTSSGITSSVVPAALYLVGEDAPTRTILSAGAGGYQRAYITLTRGVRIDAAEATLERIAADIDAIGDREDEILPDNAFVQSALGLGQI